MSSLSRALLKAMVSLLHPKMFLLMLLQVAAAIMLWMIVGVALWAQAVSLLEESMRAWDALQWLLAYWPLTLVAAHATWAVLILLMVPVVIVTTVLVVGTFAMPMMVSHVASRHYATLEERHGGTFLGSAWNGIAALAWFALLALVTSPLWLLPPAWPLLTLGLLAYLNQRVFRHDALALHAALAIDRLRREPDGERLAQAFFDAMFRHLDITLRELGVQDLGVGRRIKIMAEGLHGRALAYREALAGGPTPLAEVLRRNAYGGRPPADNAMVGRLEAYVAAYAAKLAEMPLNDLIK